ncbi:IclR family transcriptional regulator [Candidatus Bipolaricaulota bacterium]
MSTPSAKTLEKGLALVEEIGNSPEGMTAGELARSIGIHRTSVYRYVHALLQAGYIRNNGDGRYELGTKILELGSQLLRRMPLYDIAHPSLVKLSAETKKTVHLCVLDDYDVIYIDKVENQQSLPMLSRIGSRAPAYCTSVGKVLLSGLATDQLVSLLAKGTALASRTPMTITDPILLLEEIKVTTERGYAIDNGEHEEGIKCFSAPIRGYGGDYVAAISITGLKRDFDDPRETETLIATLRKTAAEISRTFGHVEH